MLAYREPFPKINENNNGLANVYFTNTSATPIFWKTFDGGSEEMGKRLISGKPGVSYPVTYAINRDTRDDCIYNINIDSEHRTI